MSNKAVLENVRRYRAVASLYRHTVAFRPIKRHSLLAEAETVGAFGAVGA
jgi:hypothetical protein